ncbi:MAG: glycosyl hydrolase [Planctomycetes bacterium]|nr:glycosyl hydrolase [Planctomycetota bacterium]
MRLCTFAVSVAAMVVCADLAARQRPRGGPQQRSRDTVTIYVSPDDLTTDLAWREIGPVAVSGRVVDVEVDPEDHRVWYVASASGGLFKTTTRGLKFSPIFDSEGTTSLGDIAIDPSNSKTIWLGTGEANNQRSSYWGDGVYKSVDAGKTWKNTGLPASHHIGRIVVDPSDGNRVFVAALGHLYSPNPERGLYRTTDGGKSWELVLKVNADVGVVDVAMQPGNSKVLLAATYERRRRAWHFDGAGPGSGLWRSSDGGDTWKRAKDIPGGEIGRIGVAFAPSSPAIAYATVENGNLTAARRARTEGGSGRGEQQGRRGRGRTIGGEIYRTEDAGKTWKKVNRTRVGGTPGYYYGQIRVDTKSADEVWVMGVPLVVSKDGGKTFRSTGRRVHVDHHAFWTDPSDPDHVLLGNDGGLCESFDNGQTWIHFENLPIGQFYAIGVDSAAPYRVYGGTQDNGTWGVPSSGPTSRGIRVEDGYKISGGDGFYACVDPEDPNTVYAESQFGGLRRVDLRTMASKSIKPRARRGESAYRFNWSSPILISPHNHATIWFGGNKLFKSLNRGDTWRAVSDDLTTQDEAKLKGNVPHCTITTIAESPTRPGLVWVGTDDGEVWLTPDDGRTWKNLNEALPKSVRKLWVSRVEASRFAEGRCYISFTGYREDRFEPLVLVTEDYGLSFRSIAGNLPKQGSVNVVCEDPRNADLLFVGTEFGVWGSTTRGGTWHRLGKGLPRVPVHDLVVHPRETDLIAGTHGRGMWIIDVCGLEHWNQEATASGSTLIEPRTVRSFPRGPDGGYTSGARRWTAPNPAPGAMFCALLASAPKKAALRVVDASGSTLKEFDLEAEAGLHVVTWNLVRSGGGGRGQRGGRFGRMMRQVGRRFTGGSRTLQSGTYRVELEVDGKKSVRPLVVK